MYLRASSSLFPVKEVDDTLRDAICSADLIDNCIKADPKPLCERYNRLESRAAFAQFDVDNRADTHVQLFSQHLLSETVLVPFCARHCAKQIQRILHFTSPHIHCKVCYRSHK